jgi:hypothetical protein
MSIPVGGKLVCEDGIARTVKRKAFGVATNGDNELVAAVANKKIRVLAIWGSALTAIAVYFTSGNAGAVLFGDSTNAIGLPANGPLHLQHNPHGWFETVAGQALDVNLSSGVKFAGGIIYVEV